MKYLLVIILFICNYFSNGQAPSIQWAKCYGGPYDEEANSILQTDDGGYIIAGYANSNTQDVSGNHVIWGPSSDFWIIKIDSIGALQWQKCFGGNSDEVAYTIKKVSYGGYIVAGFAMSNDGDVTGVHSSSLDYWIVRLDSSFSIIWQKAFGGQGDEYKESIVETSDSGFIINGLGQSIDGDMFDNTHGTAYDYWVVKISQFGTLQWERAIGGYLDDFGKRVLQMKNGRYVAAGTAGGFNHDIQCSIGGADFWIVDLDSIGGIQNQYCLGGSYADELEDMRMCSDGGLLLCGTTGSNDHNVSGLRGQLDAWVVKTDSSQNIQWQACLGGYGYEFGRAVNQTTDNGVVVAGYTNSNDSIISGHGMDDFFVASTDSTGNTLWSVALGGPANEHANDVIQTRDGGYLVCGYTESLTGDVSNNHGGKDMWVVKLAPIGLTVPENNQSAELNCWLAESKLHLEFISNKTEKANFKLFDLMGRMLEMQSFQLYIGLNKNEFQTNQLTPGVYILSLQSQDLIITKKIIVN
jgi:hypothetical protein